MCRYDRLNLYVWRVVAFSTKKQLHLSALLPPPREVCSWGGGETREGEKEFLSTGGERNCVIGSPTETISKNFPIPATTAAATATAAAAAAERQLQCASNKKKAKSKECWLCQPPFFLERWLLLMFLRKRPARFCPPAKGLRCQIMSCLVLFFFFFQLLFCFLCTIFFFIL